ncbi:prolyl oligopeptidase family serine peptidase [Sphaerisporangium sp. NPDC051011]|uniref:prolyl oligopeptidase family serine peptidase n=1 Tax=Sphaerisporangium sp. NPDC051011 TaxID=3155792 RepID=UPI0034079139
MTSRDTGIGEPAGAVRAAASQVVRFDDLDAPETRRWLAAREAELSGYLGRPDIQPLHALAAGALASAVGRGMVGAPSVRGRWIFTSDRLPGADHRVVVRREPPAKPPPGSHRGRVEPSATRVVLDPATYAEGRGPAAVDWFYPSLDGGLLAFGMSHSGSEQSAGSILDLRTNEVLPDRLHGVRHASLAWLPDGSGFFYSHYPENREYGREIRLHRLGTPQSEDTPYWTSSETCLDWPDVELSPDGDRLLVHVSIGWLDTDVHLIDLTTGDRTALVTDRGGKTRLHFTESGAIAGATSVGAPYGQVVRVDPARPEPGRWEVIVPESDLVIDDVSVSDGSLFLVGERDMSSEVGFVDLREGQGRIRFAPMPALGQVSILFPTPGQSMMRNRVVRHLDRHTAAFSWSTPAQSARLAGWNAAHDTVYDIAAWDDPPDDRPIAIRRRSATASDGRDIPMIVVEPEDVPPDARIPTLLHAYGGFGLSSTAAFSEVGRAWADLGHRYVVAGVRGGRERGDAWHREGTRSNRQRVFDDLYDVAGSLVSSGLCDPATLALWGSSNGGLLASAAIVQRPGLFAAVHAAVPMTDMLHYQYFSIARLWMSDFGDPDDPADREWIRAYSPLHNVPPDTRFPAVLVTTGLHDTRVHPVHSMAFVDALRDAGVPAPGRPILLSIDNDGGHGVDKPSRRFVHERATAFAVFLHAFGRTEPDRTGRTERGRTKGTEPHRRPSGETTTPTCSSD